MCPGLLYYDVNNYADMEEHMSGCQNWRDAEYAEASGLVKVWDTTQLSILYLLITTQS